MVAECQQIREHHVSDDFTASYLAQQLLALLAWPHRDHDDWQRKWAPEGE